MGCTQREPFVLYGWTRKAAIVNRCEKIAGNRLFSYYSENSLYGKDLWTAFSNENSMLELSNISSIDIS